MFFIRFFLKVTGVQIALNLLGEHIDEKSNYGDRNHTINFFRVINISGSNKLCSRYDQQQELFRIKQ